MKTETQEKVVLHEDLQAALNEIGNTPVDEPKLYKMLRADELKKTPIIKDVLKRASLNIKDYTAMELAKLFHQISKKVMSPKDENGVYKKTPSTENCVLPDFEEAEEIQSMWIKITEALKNEDDAKVTEISEKLDEITWKISGLNQEDLSEWEQKLVSEMMLQSVFDVSMTSLGNELKNLSNLGSLTPIK